MQPHTILLAPRDVARRLGLSVSRIVQLDREGALPALRDSANRRFYTPESVTVYEQARALARERRTQQLAELEKLLQHHVRGPAGR